MPTARGNRFCRDTRLSQIRPSVPELGSFPVLEDSSTVVVEVRDVMCRIFVPALCGDEIPFECLLQIDGNALTSTNAKLPLKTAPCGRLLAC